VEARHRGTPGWMRAPNGEPTRLNERQWVLARTPNFKAWFGNWEHDPSRLVTVTPIRRDPDAPTETKTDAWRGYVLGKLRGQTAVVVDNGVPVEFFRSGIEASLKNRNADARAIYASLPDVLRNAVYVGFEKNSKPQDKPGVIGYEHYAAAVDLDGAVRTVAVTVDLVRGATRGRGYYYHQIGDVVVGNVVGNSRTLEAPTLPPHTVSLGDLLGPDKPAASQVRDANGEPLVVYRGQRVDDGRLRLGDGLFGRGVYTATAPADTEQYAGRALPDMHWYHEGGHQLPLFLRINAPFTMGQGRHWNGRDLADLAPGDPAEQRRAALAAGYDGVQVRNEGMSDFWVAFHATAVKSAIGNAGTFRADLDHLNKAAPRALFFRALRA
jgi:hypothetical protein